MNGSVVELPQLTLAPVSASLIKRGCLVLQQLEKQLNKSLQRSGSPHQF